MNQELNYVPKKRKANYKIVVPFVLVMALGLTFFYQKYFSEEQNEAMAYTICDFTSQQTKSVLDKRNIEYDTVEKAEISDYGVYGETLKIYQETYTPASFDGFSGNTIFLTNLCGTTVDDKLPFLLSNSLDIGIDMMLLDDGLYELEILSDFNFKRIVGSNAFDETFYTAKRNNSIKSVRIFSDKDVINHNRETEIFKENYVFIEVSTLEDNKEIDVVLNPSRFSTFENGMIDYGHFYNEMSEAEETYKIAKKIKTELEKYGVRVMILRDDIKPLNNYGTGGRLEKAYNMNAKYMVNLRLESSGSQMDRGVVVLYSSLTSNRFASNIVKKLVDETPLNPTPYGDRNNILGVYQTSVSQGLDYNDIIRESGGKLTGSGTLPEFSDLMDFSKNINQGINSIDILYGYMTNQEDLETWNESNDLIAKKTAEGILIQLGLSDSGENSDH